jgi:hypothetical protein
MKRLRPLRVRSLERQQVIGARFVEDASQVLGWRIGVEHGAAARPRGQFAQRLLVGPGHGGVRTLQSGCSRLRRGRGWLQQRRIECVDRDVGALDGFRHPPRRSLEHRRATARSRFVELDARADEQDGLAAVGLAAKSLGHRGNRLQRTPAAGAFAPLEIVPFVPRAHAE